MKVQRAIEILKANDKFIADVNIDAKIAYKIAIDALIKQISIKVNFDERNYSGLPVAKCPSCRNKEINSLQSNIKYCPNCGQKLDWD